MPSSALLAHSAKLQRPLCYESPRLLADIGGTHARFAMEVGPGILDSVRVLSCADYASFTDAVAAYVEQSGSQGLRHAAIAIANPVHGDEIRMTNHHWTFSIEAARKQLGLTSLLVVNDFTALAMALPYLEPQEQLQTGGGVIKPGAAKALVGAGTGLGVGGLLHTKAGWTPLSSEGGHSTFSPADDRELAVLNYVRNQFPHVSSERLISGPGIEIIYQALGAMHGIGALFPLSTAEIVTRGVHEGDALCMETLDCFCAMLGTVAANVALMFCALGGLYIGGGVVPRLGDYFARSPFRARFEQKGRFSGYMARIPTFLITAPYPAFTGVSALLSEHLASTSVS